MLLRRRHGGVEKRGGWKTSRMTPLSKRGFGPPPSYGTFSNPLKCQCPVFPVQKSTTEQTRSSFWGVQKFSGERVLWYVFLPPYVLHPPPPISRPKLHGLGSWVLKSKQEIQRWVRGIMPSRPRELENESIKVLHYITLLFWINFPDYVIIFHITDLVLNYFLGYVISCVVTEHSMWASDYIT